MSKKLFLIIFFIFFCLFISNKIDVSVQAQESPEEGPPSQTWRCLKAEQVGGKTIGPPPKEADLTLTGSGFPSLRDTYIVLCSPDVTLGTQQATNYKCTTGNPDYDVLLFGSDLTDKIAPLTFEVPKGSNPPQTIQAAGDKINQVVHLANIVGHTNYAFFGVNINEPQLMPGQGSTLQYGTFRFQQDPAGCLSIRWDPYGRVFDSQSLEPISNVRVTLLDENKQFVSTPGLRNPENTEADGVFNFFVNIEGQDPKTFYLTPVKATHTFTAEPNLHPNYDKIYSDIYKPNDQILEYPGKPEHRDIPLDPGSNPPFTADPVSMTATSVRLGRWTRYEGTVSHPLTTVSLIGKKSGEEMAKTTADKNGFWTLFMPNDKVPHNEPLVLGLTKVDINTLSKEPGIKELAHQTVSFLANLFKKVLAVTSTEVSAQMTKIVNAVEFQPIHTYVEGYAKDRNGNIIPSAKVNVKLAMSNGVYTQTIADESGYFFLSPDNLPIFNYYLEFVPPNSASGVRVSTTEFVEMNEDYLSQNNINLMAASKNGESILPTQPPTDATDANSTPAASGRPLIAGSTLNMILTVIALVVLLGVVGGVLLYMRKKRSETDDLL